jgi:TIGR02453 family protein
MIQASTLDFLRQLAENNQRDWFHAHAFEYAEAKENVLNTAAALLEAINTFDPSVGFPEPKRCLFRIARDTRFSHDKSPYKPNFGLLLHAAGTKAKQDSPGYYFHVQPEQSFVSCGLYCPPPNILKAVRQAICEDWEDFQTLMHPTEPVGWQDLYRDEDALKRVPAGYPKDHPAASYLMLKHFYLHIPISDKTLQGKDLIKTAATHFKSMQPFNQFIAKAVKEA